MKSRLITPVAVLRHYLGKYGGEKEFSLLVGKSQSWVKKTSAGIRKLTRASAFHLSTITLICPKWLLSENKHSSPVSVFGDPYSYDIFKNHYGRQVPEAFNSSRDIYSDSLKAVMVSLIQLWEKNKKHDEILTSISNELLETINKHNQHSI